MTDRRFIVMEDDGHQTPFDRYQPDLWDDEDGGDKVFAEISQAEFAVFDKRHAGEIDRILHASTAAMDDPQRPDAEKLRISVSLGQLRRLRALAGLLRGDDRYLRQYLASQMPEPDLNKPD